MKKNKTDSVPCFCKLCNGRSVSRYLRRKHKQVYTGVTSERSPPLSLQLDHSATEDIQSVQALLPLQIVQHVNSAVPQGTQQTQECQLQAISEQIDVLSPPAEAGSPANVTTEEESQSSNNSLENLPPCISESQSNAGITDGEDYYDGRWLYTSGIAATPLCEGSSRTVLQTLVMYFHWFCQHPGISKAALSSMLYMQHHIALPTGNQLPSSYEAALTAIEPYLVQSINYDVCQNDCIVFRKQYASHLECPKCDSKRYISEESRIPVRRFTYLPLKPRLWRMFGNQSMAAVLQSHATVHNDENDPIFDIHQSVAWRRFYDNSGLFKGDGRGVLLALCTDGVNPFAHNKVSYSMWPIMLTMLNLPRRLRNKFASIMLVGIIPSNSGQEPRSLNPYLDILVDELLELSGCTLFDAYQEAPFQCKVALLLYILDYPGISKTLSVVGSGGLQGCMFCEIEGIRNDVLSKTVYLENRRFLSKDSRMRKDKLSFPDLCEETKPPPNKKVYDEIRSYHVAYDNAKNRTKAKFIAKSTGCKGSYALMRLPYHNRGDQIAPDAMHTIKDSIEKIMSLITGKYDDKASKAEMLLGRFGLQMGSDNQLPWVLTKKELQLAQERLKHLIIPAYLDFNPQYLFTHPSRLKSHDWKQIVSQGVLKYCLQDMLGKKQRESLFCFLRAIELVLAESHKVDEIPDLKENLNVALALLERDFPIAIQDITTHLLHHIVDGIQQFGPVYSTWMYSYERFNSWLCRRALNRFRPEATIMETYRIFEWCEFMMMYEDDNDNQGLQSAEVNSDSESLSQEDFGLFYPICKTKGLPVQPPVSVCFVKRIAVVEKPTERIVEYKSDSAKQCSSICASIVSISHNQFGQIKSLFTYRGVNFAIVQKFECAVHKNDGLVHIADCTVNCKAMFPLEEVSRPHLIAIEHFPELWILNA